jgi:multiple sugar transport system substrate-binding protein
VKTSPSHRRTILAAILAAAALLPGCRCGDAEPRADLVVAAFAEHEGLARTVVGRWQNAHPGKTVELVSLASGDFYSAMLPRIYSGSGVPDLLVVDAAFLARTGTAAFEDLSRPPYGGASLVTGLLPQAVAAGKGDAGAQVGLPVAASPALLFYRQDLLERAGVDERELSASWEGFVAAGVKVKAATGAYLAPQVLGVAYASLASQVEPGSSVFFGADGALRLHGPAFERAFALARSARAAELGAGMNPGTSEWRKAVQAGLLLTHLGGPEALRQLAYTAPETAGAWRAVAPPSPLPADGVYLALPARGHRHALAWELVEAALTPEGQHAAFADATAYPAVTAALEDPMLDEPVKFLGDQRLGALWREALARAPAFVPNRKDPLAAGTMQVALDQVLERNQDIRAALAGAEADARKRLEHKR